MAMASAGLTVPFTGVLSGFSLQSGLPGSVFCQKLCCLRRNVKAPLVIEAGGRNGGSRVSTAKQTRVKMSGDRTAKAGAVASVQQRAPKRTKQEEEDEEDALAEAALEALFAQLEKDLEEGGMSEDDDDNEDFTAEEVLALEGELQAVLMGLDDYEGTAIDVETEELDGRATASDQNIVAVEREDEVGPFDEEEEEEQRVVSLETWQLKKLAAAASLGRRRVNIKALAAEVGLDRGDVLAWLKNPPPELLMLGATMSEDDNLDAAKVALSTEATSNSSNSSTSSKETDAEISGFGTWYNQKRLRKEHVATFERVFRRTKRPTNSMIQNLVELTHVPRKRIVEWFDQKRQEVEPSRTFEPLR